MLSKTKEFIKKEIVFCIALILALFSMLFIKPDREYISYIDFRTLAILFCLMVIISGFRSIGMFDWLAARLLQTVHGLAGITTILVLLCIFFSMFITNDVALITFVPLALIVFRNLKPSIQKRWTLTCVVMQTIAANLGSMLTPVGNPQNLFLYGKASLNNTITGMWDFVRLMLPYSILSLVLLLAWILLIKTVWKNDRLDSHVEIAAQETFQEKIRTNAEAFIVYTILFFICLLSVAHKISCTIPFGLVLLYALLRERSVLTHVDYSLLATFTALFIFIGNLGRISGFSRILQAFMEGREMLASVLASQVMSNVPAAVLLEKFTDNIPALIVGTNLGGLGTIIASMASLISFKYISQENETVRGRYLLLFTAANVIFLAILLLAASCLAPRFDFSC